MSDYHVVREEYFKNIWLVESYVENELHSRIHDSSIPNKSVWVFPNGTLAYSMRFVYTISQFKTYRSEVMKIQQQIVNDAII